LASGAETKPTSIDLEHLIFRPKPLSHDEAQKWVASIFQGLDISPLLNKEDFYRPRQIATFCSSIFSFLAQHKDKVVELDVDRLKAIWNLDNKSRESAAAFAARALIPVAKQRLFL
jgi:hypothetical protein